MKTTETDQECVTRQNPTVMIIDDNPANLAFLFDYLEQESFRVSVAQSGANALLQLQHVKPDIILLDIMMPPGMDGFETCKLIKANPETSEIPIIFLTSLDDAIDKVKGFDLGGVDYITKPIHDIEVLARIRTHLTIRNLQTRLRQQLDSALVQVQERNQELTRTNENLTTLNERYQCEIGQRERHEREKDNLFDIVSQQTEQWQMLTQLLVMDVETPSTRLGLALYEQATQNLDLVMNALDFIAKSLNTEKPIEESTVRHFQNAMKMLDSTKHYFHQVHESQSYDPQSTTSSGGSHLNGETHVLNALTGREREVFRLLIDEKSNTEISQILLINEGSVRTYRARILHKLGVDSLVGLVKFAVKHGLVAL
ncbi:MAG: response regulator [Chloroflexota bacterium]